MARLGKKETLRICDELIQAHVFAALPGRGETACFNRGYAWGLFHAAERVGIPTWAVWRCQALGQGFARDGCPAFAAGNGCLVGCKCYTQGLRRAVVDDELMRLLGFKTWREQYAKEEV